MRFFLFVFLISIKSYAFPEMVRHNYVNCNACHVSPSGGGLLNDYGRGISRELLSTSGVEGEERFLYGVIKPLEKEDVKKWLTLGGDIRTSQIHMDTSTSTDGEFLFMQAGLEAAVTLGKFTLSGFFGETKDAELESWKAIPARLYLMYTPMDELSLRVGRFTPVFGLNIPQHIYPTRDNLGFGHDSERDVFEVQWRAETWNATASYSRNDEIDNNTLYGEYAVSGQFNYVFSDSYLVGADIWRGSIGGEENMIYGLHSILGFTPHFYFMTEWDIRKVKHLDFEGHYHFAALGYEFLQGLHGRVIEFYEEDKDSIGGTAKWTGFGPSVVWYPRPHFELELTWTLQKQLLLDSKLFHSAWLMFHYYL